MLLVPPIYEAMAGRIYAVQEACQRRRRSQGEPLKTRLARFKICALYLN